MVKEIIPMPAYKEIYDYGYDKNFLFKDRQLGQNVIRHIKRFMTMGMIKTFYLKIDS